MNPAQSLPTVQDPARARLPPLAVPGQPRKKSRSPLGFVETSSRQMRQAGGLLGIPGPRARSDLCINNAVTMPQLDC